MAEADPPKRQNATGDARAELLAIVRATRPWAGSKLVDELMWLDGWEAATVEQIEDVAGSFLDLLRDEPGGEIHDQEIDDETACDLIGTMLANAMKGGDRLKRDLLSEVITGPGIDGIPERTRQNWRRGSPHDGGLSLFLRRYARRAGRTYLEGALGFTETNARAWLRRHHNENPVTARPRLSRSR